MFRKQRWILFIENEKVRVGAWQTENWPWYKSEVTDGCVVGMKECKMIKLVSLY